MYSHIVKWVVDFTTCICRNGAEAVHVKFITLVILGREKPCGVANAVPQRFFAARSAGFSFSRGILLIALELRATSNE